MVSPFLAVPSAHHPSVWTPSSSALVKFNLSLPASQTSTTRRSNVPFCVPVSASLRSLLPFELALLTLFTLLLLLLTTWLGRLRQERKREHSICESWRSGRRARIGWTLLMRLKMESKQKDGGPMGQPRRVKPSSVIGIPAGKEPRSKLASFKTEKRHLFLSDHYLILSYLIFLSTSLTTGTDCLRMRWFNCDKIKGVRK